MTQPVRPGPIEATIANWTSVARRLWPRRRTVKVYVYPFGQRVVRRVKVEHSVPRVVEPMVLAVTSLPVQKDGTPNQAVREHPAMVDGKVA